MPQNQMMLKNKYLFIGLLFIIMFFQACTTAPIFQENKDIAESKWDYKNPLGFEVNITDTNKYCNSYINLRINADYKYSNIFIWVTTTMPDKTIEKERVEFVLQNEKGKWLGKSLGNIYSYQFQFKPRFKFNQTGIYTYLIEQNMRDEVLENVESSGLKIEFWSTESKAW